MITAWRIVKARYGISAFEGEGARRVGGRWSSRGQAIVYTAESAALAALELLVHMGRSRSLPDYVIFSCRFPESLVTRAQPKDLPIDWRSHPAPMSLRQIGDDWFTEQRSAVLRVPSAIIDSEYNYLLNPTHRSFKRIAISSSQPFELDLRLLRQ